VHLAKDEVATKIKTDIPSKTFMLTVTWNPHGFYVIDRLSTFATINSTYYITTIPQPLHQVFSPQWRNLHGEQLIPHVDNDSVHRSATTESFIQIRDMVSVSHPLYSPDLAPRDFYLFPTAKERLEHTGIPNNHQLFEDSKRRIGKGP
jgi:hypothetical protein